ncbi:MAG: ATP-binding protein [Bacteroidetes bacterium]|nr:ATP-binding protein [Bacteroidota bacterium]
MGKSGRGKTTSVRTLNPAETYIISVIPKPLPFPGWKQSYFENYFDENGSEIQGNRMIVFGNDFDLRALSDPKNTANRDKFLNVSNEIVKKLRNISAYLPHIKTIVIDDSQYLMAYEAMAKATETGYGKFNQMALNFFSIIPISQNLRDDIKVFFLHHVDDSDATNVRAKTLGKMIDSTITLEGVFSTVLYADMKTKGGKNEYLIHTQGTEFNTCKSPMGMFINSVIPNDLQYVCDCVDAHNNGQAVPVLPKLAA